MEIYPRRQTPCGPKPLVPRFIFTPNYTLVILFDGVVKDSQTGQVPAQGISEGSAEYESE